MARTGSRPKRGRGKTMFFEAKSKSLADIVSIESPTAARKSVAELKKWAGRSSARVRRSIRSATLAANRANATTKRRSRDLPAKEKRELRQVASVYRDYTDRASRLLETLRGE